AGRNDAGAGGGIHQDRRATLGRRHPGGGRHRRLDFIERNQQDNTMRCAILDDYQNIALKMADWSAISKAVEIKAFNQWIPPAEVPGALKGFEIVCAMRERTRFPKEVLEALPDLRLLISSGMRNAAIDVKAANERGVVVCGTAGSGNPTAGIAIGLM